MKRIILSIVLGIMSCSLYAQLSNTLFFDRQNYRQHQLNPAFQPDERLYVGVPIASSIAIGGGNTDLTLMDIFQNVNINGEQKTVLFFDSRAENGVENLLDALHGREQFHASYKIDLLDVGVRVNEKLFVTVSVANRLDANIVIPEEFFTFLFKGMENGQVFDFNLKKMVGAIDLYTEIGGGISAKLDDRLSLGGNIKLLLGHANMKTNFRNISMTASEDEWHVIGSGNLWTCVPNMQITVSETDRVSGATFVGSDYTQILGHGLSIDAGMNLKLTDEIQISASVLDLGFINWSGNVQEINTRENFVYNGLPYEISEDNGADGWWHPFKLSFKRLLKKNENPDAYASWLTAKLLIGGEISLLDDMLSVGVLSKTYIQRKATREEFILAGNIRVNKHLSGTLTYNLFDGWNNIGLGLNGNIGPINLFAAVDHLPLRYARMAGHKVPCYVRDTRLMVGMGVVIGYKDHGTRSR